MAGLQDIVWRSTIDDAEFLAAMQRMIDASAKFNEEVTATGKASDETLSKLGDAAVSISNDFKEMEGRMVKIKSGFGDIKQAAQGYFDKLKEGALRVRDYAKSLLEKNKATTDAAAGTGEATSKLAKFGQIALATGKLIAKGLVASGIGILVLALTGLFAFLTKTEKGMNLVKQATAGLSAVISVLVDRAELVGAAFGSFFKGDFKKGFQQLGESVKGVTKEMYEEARAAMELERAFQRLEAAQVDFDRRNIALRANLNKNRAVAEDETKSYRDRLAALQANLQIEDVLNTERVLQAEENLRLVEAEQALRTDTLEKTRAINEANLQLLEAEEIRDAARKAILQDIKALQEDRQKALEKERDRVAKLTAEYEKLADKLKDQVAKAGIDSADGLEKLALQRDFAIQQTKEFEAELRKAAAAAGKILSPEQEEDIKKLYQAIQDRYDEEYLKEIVRQLEEGIKAQEKVQQERFDIADDTYRREIDFLNKRKEVQLAELDLITEGSDAALTLEEEKEKKRLEIQRQALIAELALAKERFGPDSLEVQLLDAQLKAIEAGIKRVEGGIGPVLLRLKTKILEALNVTDAQAQFIVDSFASVFNSITQLSQSSFEKELNQNEALIQSLRERVEDLQSELEKEEEYKRNGLANNVSNLQQALNQETTALSQAEQQRIELERKAANQRLVFDSIQQASKLGLAAANVITAESPKGLVGIITATAALALLFSIFAQAQANAAKFATTKKLREGGELLVGPSHESGGIDIYLAGESRPRYNAEGGEMVVNKETTRRHIEFLRELNEGKYDTVEFEQLLKSLSPKKYRIGNLRSMARSAKRDPLRYKVPEIKRIQSQLEQWNEAKHFHSLEETIVEAQERSTAQIIDYLKSRPIDTPLEGGILREYWNGTQKVRQIIEKES
jgi:hypothetical protein